MKKTIFSLAGSLLCIHLYTFSNYAQSATPQESNNFEFELSLPQLRSTKFEQSAQQGANKFFDGTLETGNGGSVQVYWLPKRWLYLSVGYDSFSADGSIFDGTAFQPARLKQLGPNVGIGVKLAFPLGEAPPANPSTASIGLFYRKQNLKLTALGAQASSRDENAVWIRAGFDLPLLTFDGKATLIVTTSLNQRIQTGTESLDKSLSNYQLYASQIADKVQFSRFYTLGLKITF